VAAFRRDYVLAQTVALLREHGRPVAFAMVMTTDLKDKATVGLMRLRPDTVSRCAIEYLFMRLLEHFRSAGYRNLSLGMTPLWLRRASARIALAPVGALPLVAWPPVLQYPGLARF
jgi:phosphatidylglycerol lysyltransferase